MQWDIEQLFHEVVDLGSEERAAHFRQRAVPPEVRDELEALLRHDGGPGVDFPVEPIGEACGPYRLIRKLGAGGMATVYLAKRADGELEQNVAIKLLRHGADAPWLIGRFLRERQILASLRHPGIAQLLDAGRTPSGQPYLVMEYVDGIPIDEYSAPLPLRKKIEVALQVCDAVAHAHRNLVIHRDLKPSNILVDSSGHAKLLDFGIAKILDTATGVTRTRERMMTPEYASPEQVRGGSQTTATDVYLMGAVLYKLLTGSSPHIFSSEEESIDFVICKKEPPPAGLLRPGIPEDLNAILAMALRKEPESRYATMEALMDDLRAFLAYRPVKARSGDLWYRTHKFLRRYWVPVAAAAVAVTGLSAGLLLANHQRNVAQKRFLLVRQMAGRFFALDQELAQLNGSTKVRHSLVATSLEYLTALEKEAKGDPELSLEVAEALLSLSTVQGVPIGPNLGDPAAAEQSLQRAAALVHPILQADPNHREALVLSAVANESRMILAANEKRNAQSEEFATASTRQAETALALGNLSKRQSADAIRILMNASLNRLNSQRLEEGVRLARLAVTHSTQSNQPSQQGHALSLLANGLRLQGELDEALATIRKARKITSEAKYPTTTHRQMNLYGVIWREGMILGKEGGVSLGNRQAAAHAFGEAMDLALQAAAYDRDNTDARIRVASAARELGLVLTPLDPQRALAVLDQGLQSLSEAKPITKVKIETIHLLALSSHPLRQLARAPESRQRIARALALSKETGRYPSPQIALLSEASELLRAAAEQEAADGNHARAAELYRELVEKAASGSKPEADLANACAFSRFFGRLAELTPAAESGQWKARRMALWSHWRAQLPANAFVAARAKQELGE